MTTGQQTPLCVSTSLLAVNPTILTHELYPDVNRTIQQQTDSPPGDSLPGGE